MKESTNVTCGPCASVIIERIKAKHNDIHSWLESHEKAKELPLYSSVDIRDAGFKISVVDTNLFPAGFNNLCEHGIEDSTKFIRQAILERVPGCKNILIIAEEHTRNTWYLENIRVIQGIIEAAGFNVKAATFVTIQPAFCESANYIELETATQKSVRIYCVQKILEKIKLGIDQYDLIIMNNDLSGGIPEVLKNSDIPIYPSLQAGWHSRSKAHHFKLTCELMREFAGIVNMDPWFFSSLFTMIDQVNINNENDRVKLMDLASDLFKRISAKYAEHQISEKPFVFIKSDSGTSGLGVQPIEDPKDILELNHRARNDLSKGKSSQTIDRFLIQEGVPTIYTIDEHVSEVCVYQIANNMVGGFYRSNAQKSSRENLNSPGMEIKKMCPHLPKYGRFPIHPEVNVFDVYRILARVAGIAAHREIIQLEKNK